MTDLVITEDAHTPAAPRPPRSRAIGESLAKSEEKFLIDTDKRPWSREAFSKALELRSCGAVGGWRLWSEARQALELGPPVADIESHVDRLEIAVEGPPEPRATRYMIALMVAAFPNGKPADIDVYCETLLHDAVSMGFTPQVVARACRTLRHTAKFLPSVSEFIEAGTEAKSDLDRARRHSVMMRDLLRQAAAIASQPEPTSKSDARSEAAIP